MRHPSTPSPAARCRRPPTSAAHSPALPPSLRAQALSSPSLAAEAPVGQGTLSKQQAAELQRLLEARGAKLPELKSSPNVRWLLALVATAHLLCHPGLHLWECCRHGRGPCVQPPARS